MTQRLVIVTFLFGGDSVSAAKESNNPAAEKSDRFFDSQIDPAPESNFALACFRLWLPPGKEKVRGILAVMPPSDSHGTPAADDAGWQRVAEKWNFALLAATFTTRLGYERYYLADRGSGAAFLTALGEFARESSHPELETVPIAILGHSQGGQFAFQFACWKPERVLAFAAIKGGYYSPKLDDAVRQIPGLLIAGDSDSDYRRINLRKLFELNPAPGGKWCFLMEHGTGHETARSPDLIVSFFDAVVNGDLQPYHANVDSHEIAPASPTPDGLQGWLPNRSVAALWQALSNGTPAPESALDLSIPVDRPPELAQVSPATHDFGKLTADASLQPITVRVHALPGESQWDTVRALSTSSRCEVEEVSGQEVPSFTITPKLEGFPLGTFKETIQFRFFRSGKPVLGIAETVISARKDHPDVALSPRHIYIGSHDGPREYRVKITARNGKHLKVAKAERSTGVAADIRIENTTDTTAEFVCTFHPLDEKGDHSGAFSIHLSEPVATEVRLPFMGYYKPAGDTD